MKYLHWSNFLSHANVVRFASFKLEPTQGKALSVPASREPRNRYTGHAKVPVLT